MPWRGGGSPARRDDRSERQAGLNKQTARGRREAPSPPRSGRLSKRQKSPESHPPRREGDGPERHQAIHWRGRRRPGPKEFPLPSEAPPERAERARLSAFPSATGSP